MPDTSQRTTWQPDDTLENGKYRLDVALGSGAFATVWLATDTADDAQVAIKILHRNLTQHQRLVQRFRQEKAIGDKLRKCPYVVAALSYLHQDGENSYDAIVMEYIPGGKTLWSLMQSGSLTPTLALKLIADILRGLDVAHAAGIIHRDLKPENVLLHPEGLSFRAMISDFGVSGVSDRTNHLTKTGMALGTTKYMPGELAIDASRATPRSDLCTVGMMLAEMFGIPLLVDGDAMPRDVIAPMLSAQVIAAWVASVPAVIRPIVEKATYVEYDQASGTIIPRRYASAQLMLRDVETLLAHPEQLNQTAHATASSPQAFYTYIAPPPKRWPWVVGVVAFVMAVTAGWMLWPKAHSPVETPAVETTETPKAEQVSDPEPKAETPEVKESELVQTPPVETPAVETTETPKTEPPKPEAKPEAEPKVKTPKPESPVEPPKPEPKATVAEPKVTITSHPAQVAVGENIVITGTVELPSGTAIESATLRYRGERKGAWQKKPASFEAGKISTSLVASAADGNAVEYYLDVRLEGNAKAWKCAVVTTTIAQ